MVFTCTRHLIFDWVFKLDVNRSVGARGKGSTLVLSSDELILSLDLSLHIFLLHGSLLDSIVSRSRICDRRVHRTNLRESFFSGSKSSNICSPIFHCKSLISFLLSIFTNSRYLVARKKQIFPIWQKCCCMHSPLSDWHDFIFDLISAWSNINRNLVFDKLSIIKLLWSGSKVLKMFLLLLRSKITLFNQVLIILWTNPILDSLLLDHIIFPPLILLRHNIIL